MDSKEIFSLWYVRALVVLGLIGVVGALGAYTYTTLKASKYQYMGPTTINVRGEGEVMAKPDIGSFSFSVRAEGATAPEAQQKSAEAINSIMDFLRGSGVEEKDIKTEGYNLNPKYTYEDTACNWGYCPPSEPKMDGFEVYQRIVVKVRNLDSAGDLMTGVGDKGATEVSNLDFTIDDESSLKAEAREKAIKDAKEKGEKLAKDLGVKVVKMVGYYEEEGYYPTPYYGGYDMMAKSEAMMGVSPEVPTGENTIRSVVNITYEIK